MPGGDYRDALRDRAGWVPEAGPLLDVDGAQVGRARRRRRRTRSASARGWASRSASRATSRASTRCRTRSSSVGARTSRRATFTIERRVVRGAGRARRRRSVPRSGSATARRPIPATVGARRASAGPIVDTTRRCGPPRPARPRSCTTARRSSAAVGSSARSRPVRGGCGARAARMTGARRLRRVSIEPALILSLLVGSFHAALSVLIRGFGGRSAAAARRRGDPRGVGRDALADRLGLGIAPDRGLHLSGRPWWPGSGSRSSRWWPSSDRHASGREDGNG